MKYTILSCSADGDNIITEVEYALNEFKIVVSLSHFQPQNIYEIIAGVDNRAKSEQRRIDATALCKLLVPQVVTGVEVTLDG